MAEPKDPDPRVNPQSTPSPLTAGGPTLIDPMAVRRQFGRRAARLAEADFLLRQVETQMLERLDIIKLQPEVMLDVGCGLGDGLLALRRQYPGAMALGVDVAEPVLQQAVNRFALPEAGWMARLFEQFSRTSRAPLASLICADTGRLPLPDNSVDLIWSNLCLHWISDTDAVVQEWHRVIRPGGLVMFSFFGVDTLAQLRAPGNGLMPFRDMHDVGDTLITAGLADPVMDMHQLTLQYQSPEKLLGDLRALGGNAMAGRRRGLTGRSHYQQWQQTLLQHRDNDGLIDLTVEVCHGHAWCPPQKRLPRGLSRIEFHKK